MLQECSDKVTYTIYTGIDHAENLYHKKMRLMSLYHYMKILQHLAVVYLASSLPNSGTEGKNIARFVTCESKLKIIPMLQMLLLYFILGLIFIFLCFSV